MLQIEGDKAGNYLQLLMRREEKRRETDPGLLFLTDMSHYTDRIHVIKATFTNTRFCDR